jgi:hypothetical protein
LKRKIATIIAAMPEAIPAISPDPAPIFKELTISSLKNVL